MNNLHVIIVAMPGTWQKMLKSYTEAYPSVGAVELANGSLSAVQLAEVHPPDMLLIDSSIPTDETVALIKNVKQANPATCSVVLTDTSRQGRRITLAGADYTLPTYSLVSRIGEILNTLLANHRDDAERAAKTAD